jgi:hypothetical protein
VSSLKRGGWSSDERADAHSPFVIFLIATFSLVSRFSAELENARYSRSAHRQRPSHRYQWKTDEAKWASPLSSAD